MTPRPDLCSPLKLCCLPKLWGRVHSGMNAGPWLALGPSLLTQGLSYQGEVRPISRLSKGQPQPLSSPVPLLGSNHAQTSPGQLSGPH